MSETGCHLEITGGGSLNLGLLLANVRGLLRSGKANRMSPALISELRPCASGATTALRSLLRVKGRVDECSQYRSSAAAAAIFQKLIIDRFDDRFGDSRLRSTYLRHRRTILFYCPSCAFDFCTKRKYSDFGTSGRIAL